MRLEPEVLRDLIEEENNSRFFRKLTSILFWSIVIAGWAWIIKDAYLELMG